MALIAIGFPGLAATQPRPEGLQPTLSSILDASRLDPTERRAIETRFDALATGVAERLDGVRSPARRARRLHRLLHERVFLHYRDDADGVSDVMARGEFNCVSSTLVEGLLAESLGLRPTIVSGPHHILLRLALPSRVVDVETTVRDGFDVRGSVTASERFLAADGVAGSGAVVPRGALATHDDTPATEVKLADGAAFVWHNGAERALARGEGRDAAQRLAIEQTLYPGIAAGEESLQTQLGRAFRLDYDAGKFDDAYVSAAIAVQLGPRVVSAQDRLIAAATQRIERLADRGDLEQIDGILADVRRLLGDGSIRFERHVLPLVVAAAVRIGDWERADCLSDRFATVELDAVESRRLLAWVRGRRTEAESAR